MKILMLTTDHLMIDRRILQHAETLVEHGHEVTLLAGFECPKPEEYSHKGIRIHRYTYDWNDARVHAVLKKFKIQNTSKYYAMLWKIVQRLISYSGGINSFEHFVLEKIRQHSYDIVHVHDFPMLKVGTIAAKEANTKLIYDSHELYHAQSQLPKTIQKLYRKLEKKLIPNCHAVITVNPFIAEIMQKDYRIKLPTVIYNVTEESKIEPIDLRKKLGLADDTFIMLYQGWISAERGIDVIIRAMKYVPDHVKAVIIGYGDHLEALKTIAKEDQTEHKIIFYGQVEPDEMLALTVNADVSIIPYHAIDLNHYYCSPNKLFEYIMAGVPMICNKLPFLEMMIKDHGIGVAADINNPRILANTISELAAEPEKLKAIKNKVEQAKAIFNWKVESQKLLTIYETL